MDRLGFIGLGVMGGPMAGHLAAAGHPMTVYDISEGAIERLQAAHPDVKTAPSPRAVAEAADIVITMLPSGKEVRETALGQGGLLEGLTPGSLLLDTSSAEPWLTREVAERLGAIGVAMVDAPVSGAEAGAKGAQLVFMTGGTPKDIERVRPLLEVMGKSIFHLGPVGSGHVMKSLNNLITAVTLTVTTEGLLAGTRAGLDPDVMNQVLDVSTGQSWVSMTHFRQRIFNGRYNDPFKLDLMKKDMDIAMRVAADAGVEMPVAAVTRELWQGVQAAAPPAASVSHLVQALEEQAGVKLRPG